MSAKNRLTEFHSALSALKTYKKNHTFMFFSACPPTKNDHIGQCMFWSLDFLFKNGNSKTKNDWIFDFRFQIENQN